ncbi:MAG: methyltransferase domain-containing protein [Chthoniobacterales bacterium]
MAAIPQVTGKPASTAVVKRQFDPTEPELMDRPQPVTPALVTDLRNLRQLNRHFGSYALIRRFLRRWIKAGERIRVLDLATGSGDIPRLVVDHARKIGATVEVDAVDQQASTLEIARTLSSHYPEINFIQGDILAYEGEPYDFVLCTLALHHFAEDAAVRLLQRCRVLSKQYVLVSDLRRGFVATAGVHLLTVLIFREPMTQVDARLSAARAFSFEEFGSLARRAGWANFGHAKFAFARQAIWLESGP